MSKKKNHKLWAIFAEATEPKTQLCKWHPNKQYIEAKAQRMATNQQKIVYLYWKEKDNDTIIPNT